MRAAAHPRQDERLAALRSFGILDTPRERDFDEVVELISQLCDAPIAVVNLIDENRQWFKAEVGLGVRETPLETSICSHVILVPGLTVIPDTLADDRLRDNPMCLSEPHLRFYAGMCLETEEGLPIGTLCVLDTRPRQLTELQKQALMVLGRQVMRQISLSKALRRSELLRQEIDHRVKNSLAVVMSLLSMQARKASSDDVVSALTAARERIAAMVHVHDQLQRASQHDYLDARLFLDGLVSILGKSLANGTEIVASVPDVTIAAADAVNLGIVINELVANAIKHGSEEGRVSVSITGRVVDNRLNLAVCDDGAGLPDGFDPTAKSGLGMQVCLSLTQALGDRLTWLNSSNGARFQFSTPIPSV